MTYPEWVHQSVVETLCFQLEQECISICTNVGYHLGETGKCSVGGRVSDMCDSIFCRFVTGRTWGESVHDVSTLI